MKSFLPPLSFSGWFAFSFFVLVFGGVVFRVARIFKSCFGFNRRRSQGGPLFQMLFWFSSVSGFGLSHFQPLLLTLPPTINSSGTGRGLSVSDRCFTFNLLLFSSRHRSSPPGSLNLTFGKHNE